ncbi:hypothetical protein [Lactobacillus taiwanensis]|uniref:hypothetical protein n=2 Tax=Lactobacillus taiwanensis TaxID=508451 RepID=UPI0035258D4A
MIRICSSIIDFGMHTDITNGKPDFTKLDEVVAEIDAQYHRFLELIGKKLDYFEGHAVGKRSDIAIVNMAKQKSILREEDNHIGY